MKQKKWYSLVPVIALIVMLAVPQTASAIDEANVKAMLKTMNDQLAAAGEDFRIAYVDLETHDEVGIIVYANDRQHQLDNHWLPYDPWRFGTRDIYWAIDNVDQALDVPWGDAVAAIGRAMNLWNTVPCANIPLVQVNDFGFDLGVVQNLVGMGGNPGWLADITHAGFLPWIFFEIIGGPGGGDSILGVTFTFVWTARPEDVAFREIYENDEFDWGIDIRYFDIETVVAHEVGHGLSLGHFGKIFRSKNGKLHFAPRALMNALYYDILHELLGTDNASFCSIWASWPNN
jgi:hypothetical protein